MKEQILSPPDEFSSTRASEMSLNASDRSDQTALEQRLFSLFIQPGRDICRAYLEDLSANGKIKEVLENFIRGMQQAQDVETTGLQMKSQYISSRAENNFRAYLQPQLEKFFLWLLLSNETTNYTYDLHPLNKAYLASTIALVTGHRVEQIGGFLDEISNDHELREHIKSCILTLKSKQRYHCDLNVQFGRRIGWYAFVRVCKPRVVIETGVEKGMGTLVLARALMINTAEGYPGFVYGTEINPKAGFFFKAPYNEHGRILYGDSIESLARFTEPIDLFINDSDHSDEYERAEYATIKNKLSPGAIILGDNSHGNDELRRFALETGRKFLFFAEKPLDHWYPGAGIGIAFEKR